MEGLAGIWESYSKYLTVDTEVSDGSSEKAVNKATVKFRVKNTATPSDDEPDVIFEEVQLKVGTPSAWHTEKTANLAGGQTFAYEYACSYDDLLNLQWKILGTISPKSLLQFNQRPKNITRNGLLPVKAYFDYLDQLNVHQWLNGVIQTLDAPGPDTTLAEMKAKESSLSTAISEIRGSNEKLQNFMGWVDSKRNRDEVNLHQRRVQDYLTVTTSETGTLIQTLKTHRADDFRKTRDHVVSKLSERAKDLYKATGELKAKLGLETPDKKTDQPVNTPVKVVPPPTPLREIDLHKTPNIEEAIPLLENFIKESYRDNVRTIRIIHGKGIGVLRNAVRLHLENHKLVKSVGPADKDHGGEGATEAVMVDFSTKE